MAAKNLATNAAHFARNGVDLKQVMSLGHILTTTRKDTITWMPAKHHSSGTNGKLREVDDYQPRAQIHKLFHGKEISSSDERKIEELSRKYVVAVGLVREYILHLEHLDLLKRKREREESQKKSEKKEKAYKDYNWRQLYETRQIKV